MLTIHLLPVLYGDTILINIPKSEKQANTNILIDCGYNFTSELLPLLEQFHADGKRIDRFIITHYDDDHIRSAAKFIKDNGSSSSPKIIEIEQVWLNAYRHLQFDKRDLPPLDDEQEVLLKNFIAVQNSDVISQESEIGAKQASKLGRELYSGSYCWNKDFEGKAVCIEHKTEVIIKEGVICKILGPTKHQLTALEDEFKKGLKEMGVKLSDTELIDDAFELFIKAIAKKDIEGYIGNISGSAVSSITPDIIQSFVKNTRYKADKAIGNGSSISFVLEADEKKILMLADAHAEPIIKQLNATYPDEDVLYFDAIKVGHHGSLGNNPKELYEYIDSPIYLISTNGGHPSHVHPDIETVAFIISRPLRGTITSRKIVFNYYPKHLAGIFDKALMEHFNYTVEVNNLIELP
ncbi:MBL fold metallo-hydrolase [Pedobacter sp. N36a]|uniref:MBL fold metallo-hydrolase n=1 Tax=Pedobacter sp. N36a TaxID=2767996 RepID=UPI001656ACC3|nr:MBL fold metallo-hydrolase [Pedobacter sp. N36a]MBC8988431.1 MBL fold metallo-hydrolase [Pedobacter sp. N36a]